MASAPFFTHFTTLPARNPSKHPIGFGKQLVLTSRQPAQNQSSTLQAFASSLALPINVDYLKREFSDHGVRFEGIGDSCVVKMVLENGSKASLMLPSGLITSYKPFMWHGATAEVLHTLVSQGENGEVVIRGGVSMDLNCHSDGGLPWSSNKWALLDVKGSSEQSIQVELVSVSPKDMVEVKCLVTLQQDLLASEITVTNPSSSHLQLLGSVLSHLTVSTPDATYAIGLQGSSYHNRLPMVSNFSIIPPNLRGESSSSIQPLAQKGFDALFSGWNKRGHMHEEEGTEEEEEDDDYAQMTEKMCRVYSNAPRQFTIIDRGKRNSVVVQRSGFEELYIFSPGSDHEWYGKYAYICVGASAVLQPVVLGPGGSWTGAQYLYNPNL